MNIEKLLQGVQCSCGKTHRCDIGYVSIKSGAIACLEELCKPYGTILLVADENTFAAAGAQTEAALHGKTVRKVIFSGKTILIPDEAAVAAVTEALADIALIIGIGSGVIQDLCKFVSHQSGIPYFVVATAPSMDGYASTGAAMIVGGMKVTYSAKVPEAIIADTEVLKNAPFDMIQAGYGDIVGKYSALNDWKLSHVVNGEYLCPEIYGMTMDMVTKTLELAEGLVRREEESIRVLMEALVVVGIAMSFAGSSRPASGSEHHLSHFFEITGIVHGEEYFPHGIDVAYSTVVTAGLREKLLGMEFPAHCIRQPRSVYEAEMDRVYGSVGSSCVALQDKVGTYAKDLCPVYREKEEEIRAILAEMPRAAEIEAMLTAVGMDLKEFHRMYSAEKLADAVAYAKDLKDRYTVLWMYYDFMGGRA